MSSHEHEPSVEELRRQSERTRANLVNTADELRAKVTEAAGDLKHRASPAHIKEEIKDYVRDSGEQLYYSLERKARANPLQAVAIGAGLAYPVWSVIRKIPAPIMLIGAGLLLAKKGQGLGLNQRRSVGANTTQGAAELGSTVQGKASQAANRIAETAADAKAAAFASAKSVADKALDLATDAKSAAADVVSAVQNTAAAAAESASETASKARERAVEMSGKSRDAVMAMAESNPLLVAGVGLGIGAFIAASLPPSDAENRWFGETSEELKKQARKAASRGVQQAKDMAADVASDVTAAVEREGLSVEGVKEAVSGLTEGVKSVADRGLQAALGRESDSPSQYSTQPYKS